MINLEALYANRVRNVKGAEMRRMFQRSNEPGVIALSGGLPNPKGFPVEALIEATEKCMRADGRRILQYADSTGLPELREWVAERYRKQGLGDVTADMINIMSGSLQGLDLTGKTFLEPGDTVLIEGPAFLGAIQTLSMYQPRFVEVPLNDDGIDIDALAAALKANPQAKLVEVCPNFQNPSGVSYTDARRKEFARVMAGHNTLVLEDDPYADLRYDGTKAVSLRRECGDQVIALGSFSKIVSPGMRIGWVMCSKALAPKYTLGKQTADSHASNFAQRVVHQYLMDNDIDTHIAKTNAVYKAQRDAMLKACADFMPPGVSWTHPAGGMFVWLTLPPEADAWVLFEDACTTDKVAVVPGTPFYASGKGGKNQLRLSFSTVEPEVIAEGIQRLARAIVRHLDGVA